jgi:hypothetical protein
MAHSVFRDACHAPGAAPRSFLPRDNHILAAVPFERHLTQFLEEFEQQRANLLSWTIVDRLKYGKSQDFLSLRSVEHLNCLAILPTSYEHLNKECLEWTWHIN